jgi:outer membrane protein assembly factor BamB
MKIRSALWVLALAAVSCAAENAPADYYLCTFATASYQDGSGHPFYAYSAQTGVRVKQVLGLLASVGPSYISLPQGTAADIPGVLTNTGNGLDSYTLSVEEPPEEWQIYLLEDTNGDGIRQSGEWTRFDSSGLVDRGQTKRFFIRYQPPWGTVPTDGVQHRFSISSDGGTSIVTTPEPQWGCELVLGRNAPMYASWLNRTWEPVIADAGGDEQYVYYAGAEGSLLWTSVDPWDGHFTKTRTNHTFVGGPAVTVDRLAWTTAAGRLATFNKATKQLIRSVAAPGGASFVPSPAAYDFQMIAASSDRRLHAVNRDGVVAVSSGRLNADITTDPLVVGDEVFVGTSRGELACFNAFDLSPRWLDRVTRSAALTGRLAASPDGRTLLAASSDGRAYAYRPASRTLCWSVALDSEVIGLAFAEPGQAMFLTADRNLYGFDASTGELLLGFPFSPEGDEELDTGLVVVARDEENATPYAWLTTPDGHVYAVNTKMGLTYYHYELTEDGRFIGHPSIAGGTFTSAVDSGWGYGFEPR